MKAVSLAIAMFVTVSTTGRPVNFTVSNNSDAGAGSFRQAIVDVNTAGGGTITFSGVSGTIALGSSLPVLETNTVILGPGANRLTVSAATASVLTNRAGSSASIRGLRLTGIGGVVLNSGKLSLNECVVGNGSNSRGNGVGIYNAGNMYLRNCLVTNNFGSPVCKGAGIYNAGELSMEDCTVSGNDARSNDGGGIYNAGTMNLRQCSISGNKAEFGSGCGIYNSGTMTLTACTLARNNFGGGADGGGIF